MIFAIGIITMLIGTYSCIYSVCPIATTSFLDYFFGLITIFLGFGLAKIHKEWKSKK